MHNFTHLQGSHLLGGWVEEKKEEKKAIAFRFTKQLYGCKRQVLTFLIEISDRDFPISMTLLLLLAIRKGPRT